MLLDTARGRVDHLADPRLGAVSVSRLRAFLKEEGASPRELERMTTKFSLVRVAEQASIDLEPVLSESAAVMDSQQSTRRLRLGNDKGLTTWSIAEKAKAATALTEAAERAALERNALTAEAARAREEAAMAKAAQDREETARRRTQQDDALTRAVSGRLALIKAADKDVSQRMADAAARRTAEEQMRKERAARAAKERLARQELAERERRRQAMEEQTTRAVEQAAAGAQYIGSLLTSTFEWLTTSTEAEHKAGEARTESSYHANYDELAESAKNAANTAAAVASAQAENARNAVDLQSSRAADLAARQAAQEANAAALAAEQALRELEKEIGV